MLPFSTEQFLGVFEAYNEAVWPMQVVLGGVALIAILLATRKPSISDFTISTVLAAFWLWMGIVYHILFFSDINVAAIGFGVLFVVQALLFHHAGPVKKQLSFGTGNNWNTILGASLLLYAVLIYPVVGLAVGHGYPRQPTFGVPCPTTIFTFGMLLWTDKRVPRYLLVIPTLWAAIGTTATFFLGVWQDLGLFVAAVFGVLGVLSKDARYDPSPN